MAKRRGCGCAAYGALFVVVASLVLAAFVGAMILSSEIPLYGPRLTGIEPLPGSPFVPSMPITLTFDQPMDPASVEASFSLEPVAAGTFHWERGNTKVTFVPDGLGYEPGRTYNVQLAAGARAGTLPRVIQRDTGWWFTLPPLLETFTPPAGEEDLGAWTQLEANFNYPLECGFTMHSFSIEPDAVGVLECRDGYIAFTPVEPLAPDTAYTASIGRLFLEGDPDARPGIAWTFRTAPALSVIDVSPDGHLPLVDLWTPIRISFNRPVVAQSVEPRFTLISGNGTAHPGQITWEQDGAAFVFEPERALHPASQYNVILEKGVQDELGFELGDTLKHEFSTLHILGLPLPVPGAKDVVLGSEVRIPFTRPMDRASVEANLTFSPSLEGEVSWEQDIGGEEILVLAPRGGLAADTTYEVGLSADVRDASGATLAKPRRWAFGTEAFLQKAEVPSTTKLRELREPVTFTFALPMDRASVRAALKVSPDTSGDLIWSEDSREVAFQPDPAWEAGADYEIVLEGLARSADGYQTLDVEQAWSFATASAEVQFGEGPNAQVVGADGERAFQVVARGADVADFALYAITPTQFLDLYSSSFRGVGPEVPLVMDTKELTATVTWREALVPLEGEARVDWQVAEAHIPSDVPPGMYILTSPTLVDPAQDESIGGVGDGLLVVLTHHALVLKRALAGSGPQVAAQVVAWDTEISSGTPVMSATVRLYDRDGAFLAEGATDEEGLSVHDVAGDPGPLIALSDVDGDVTVCGLGNEWSEEGWWWWWGEQSSRPLHTVYSYTDRPIYRPNQAIYFKNWIRADDDVSYTLPGPELPVTVRLRDGRDNVAATQVLSPTQFGTVYGEFLLADEPMLGDWNLETEVAGTISRQPLKVEEYRKPEYQVTVETPKLAYVQDETITATVKAAFYFGQPVADAEVVLQVYPVYPDGFWVEMGESAFGYPILVEKGRTDPEGQWVASVPTGDLFSGNEEAGQLGLALEATVTDEVGQSVSSYRTAVVHRTSQGLALLLERHGYEPNEEILFSAQIRDQEGEPVPGVEIAAQVLGWDDREVAGAEGATDSAGLAQFSVEVAEQGWYQIHVVGTDDGGREMWVSDHFWVYDSTGQAPWYQGHGDQDLALAVSADRRTYVVGEEAQVVVYTQVPGPALLTLERGETRQAEPIELVSGTNLITVPILAEYAPNIHVKVNQFGSPGTDWWQEQSLPEAELHTASVELQVPMTDRLLTVTLTADQDTYIPGEEAQFQVQVTDKAGQPVVAEVSLAVVDEAIYALAEDLSGDPFDAFYGPRPNLVRTFDSLRPTRWLFAEGAGLGGGGDGAGGAPRRDFQDTAYWAPAVVTDEGGEATITFELPDNLTEWRALARAVTTDTLVGQTTIGVVVGKDIVLRPALPRFLVQGDGITLTTVVHNYTPRPVSATVQLELDGLTGAWEQNDVPPERVVHVPAGGWNTAGWAVAADVPLGYDQNGLAEAQVMVQTTATRGARIVGRDSVELPLPVYPLAIPEVTASSGELTPDRPTDTMTITLPADALEGLSRLEINLAPSIAPGLLQGLEYLIDYPFG